MSKVFTALGLMSGTSMDGIDAAIIKTDGHKIHMLGPTFSSPYIPEMRALLQEAVEKKNNIDITEEALTLAHAEVVNLFLHDIGINHNDIDLIGFHGHTIDHQPHRGMTWQIGNGELLAKRTLIDVIHDFRTADVKAGGQGAPLAPLYHQALFSDAKFPVIIVNLGGVGNITYIHDDTVIAFDTGPANCLLDQWMEKHTKNSYDNEGQTALRGKVHHNIVDTCFEHSYFKQKPPKSLDRSDFSLNNVQNLSLEDGAATLAFFTAATVLEALQHLPQSPQKCYVCGGGRLNNAIMKQLNALLPCEAENIDTLGFDGDMIEAQAFAYLAVRSYKELPLTYPTTTGTSSTLVTGGVFCPV